MRTRWISAIVALILAATTGGCGSSSPSASPTTRAESSTASTNSAPRVGGEAEPCSISDGSTTLTVYGGESCTVIAREAASSGDYWHPVGEPHGDLDCAMARGAHIWEVRGSGSPQCAHLLAHGWTETEGPKPKAEREANEAKQREGAETQRREEAERPKREAEERKRTERESLESEGKAP